MRVLIAALFFILSSPTLAAPTKPKLISSEKAIKGGQGVVAVSIRSEIFLPDKLDVFFLRDGGSIVNDKDVIRFSRSQSMMAVSNDTTDYATKTFLLAPGRYRLVGYGVNCPGVPPPGMVCAVSISVNGTGGLPIPRPSKRYEGKTPEFVVEAGKLTIVGDMVLLSDNEMKWSALPETETGAVMATFPRLASGSDPEIPESFQLSREIRAHGMFENFGRRY